VAVFDQGCVHVQNKAQLADVRMCGDRRACCPSNLQAATQPAAAALAAACCSTSGCLIRNPVLSLQCLCVAVRQLAANTFAMCMAPEHCRMHPICHATATECLLLPCSLGEGVNSALEDAAILGDVAAGGADGGAIAAAFDRRRRQVPSLCASHQPHLQAGGADPKAC
jgi:hypothetical protein